jgi:hypothetical protein
MSNEEYFRALREKRQQAVTELVLPRIPEKDRAGLEPRIRGIVERFEGREGDAISVLMYAAEKGRTDEFLQKLEGHYRDSLQDVHPEARRDPRISGALRAEAFILHCYEEMDVQPQRVPA